MMSRRLRVVVFSQTAVLLGGGLLWSADVKKGESLYAARCMTCHVKDLKGNASMTNVFKVEPAKLNLIDKETLAETDEDLTTIITKGKNKMPAQEGKVKPEDIADLIAYIRSVGAAGAKKSK